MGFAQRLTRRVLPGVDRRIDWRLDRKLEERVLPELPRQGKAIITLAGDVARTSDQLTSTLDALRLEMGEKMGELRRWMIDDLEAANEATVLMGESLARLQASVERLGEDVAGIAERLTGIEAALARG
ncbi:MAG: hypothetical protein ACRDY7_18520 [Acidimicrobiia bacterium]